MWALFAPACTPDGTRPTLDDPPFEATLHATYAAPVSGASWEGPWVVTVHAAEPRGALARAIGGALSVPVSTWNGVRPEAPPGTVAVLVVAPATSAESLEAGLGAPPGVEPGEVVVVLGPGDRAWTRHLSATLPWLRVGLVDPVATASFWTEAAALDDGLLGTLAARTLADSYRLDFAPSAGPLPPGLDAYLGVVNPASLAAADPRTRASAASTLSSDDLVDDPEVAVRIAVAFRTASQTVLGRLATDREPLVRARAAERLDDLATLATLTADPSSVVRVVAAGRLASLAATAPAVTTPTLVRLASSSDAYLRWKAAWGLGLVPDSTPTLLVLLADVDVDVRREAAHALARRREPAAIDALVAAARDSNSFVRRWAVDGLSAYQGDARVRLALEAAAADPSALVAVAAARGLGTRPVPIRSSLPPKGADEVEARARNVDPTLRKDLCLFLAGRREWAGVLVRLAGDADSEVRKSAIGALGWLPDQGPTLVAALSDPDPDVVVTALEALARSGSGDVPAFAPLRAHPDAEIRLRAAEAMASLGASAPLEAALADPDERVRAAAVAVYPHRLAQEEPSVLVRRAAAAPADPDALVRAVGGPPDLRAWALGVIAREDDLVHTHFSWNNISDRPATHRMLRPPVARPYGHPNRG